MVEQNMKLPWTPLLEGRRTIGIDADIRLEKYALWISRPLPLIT